MGTAANTDNDDTAILSRLCNCFNQEQDELGRYALVPRHLDFDTNPSIVSTKQQHRDGGGDYTNNINSMTRNNSLLLNCYWNQGPEDFNHWEESIERLEENVIQIMKRWGLSFLILLIQQEEDASVEEEEEVYDDVSEGDSDTY
jgi:hypothetical protein